MDEVKNWLCSNGLGGYSATFEENGWDEMYVLQEMTDNDIKICIPKAGHRAKFKVALRSLGYEPGNSSTSQHHNTPQSQESAVVCSREQPVEDPDDVSTLLPVTLQAGRSKAITITTSSARGPHFSTKERVSEQEVNTKEKNDAMAISNIVKSTEALSTKLYTVEDDVEATMLKEKPKADAEDTFSPALEIAALETFRDELSGSTSEGETSKPLAFICTQGQASKLLHGANLNFTIIKHSEHTTVAEGSSEMPEDSYGSTNIVENLKEQMEMIANSFELKDHLFVETRAFKELKAVVEETHWATLLGKPGDGKSSTAAHLLLKYRDSGYEPVFVSSPQDWKMLISSNRVTRQFVVIDDMFGTSYIDKKRVIEWQSVIEQMERIVKQRKGKLIVVCTSRRYIFSDVESSVTKYCCFGKPFVVDMTDKANQLSGEEKLAIFSKFAEKHHVTLDEESLNDLREVDPPHGFPHCVELFCTNAFLRQDGLSFFKNPTKCVQKEIHNFKDNDPFKFIVLLLLLLKKSHAGISYFGKMINSPSEDEIKLFKTVGLAIETAYPGITKALDALTNTYLKLASDSSYSFSHESVEENVAAVYITVNPVHATELLSFQQIVLYTNQDSQDGGLPLPVDLLVEHTTKEILMGNIDVACQCNSWNDQKFVDEWVRYITYDGNIPAILLNVILSNIFCSTNKSYWSLGRDLGNTRKNLLATLIRFRMKVAVVALLKSKFLQEILKRFPVWKEIIQQSLHIACSTIGDFDIDIILGIIKHFREVYGAMLNGSYALLQSLKFSKIECAKLLLNETNIDPKYYLESGGYLKELISSNIVSKDFDTLLCALLDIGVDINQRGTYSVPPLFTCVAKTSMRNSDFEKLACLVTKGADINATAFPGGSNIVSFAVRELTSSQCLYILPKLKELGASFEQNVSALHLLCAKSPDANYLDLLNYLIDSGVSCSPVDNKGQVPLMLALQNDPGIDSIQRLVPLSPSKHKDKFGQGYFHHLFQCKCNLDRFCSYCNLLLRSGEDINLTDSLGKPPAFVFCEKALANVRGADETTNILQFLQSVGVYFQGTDDRGKNILHYLFSKYANPALYLACPCSMCVMNHRTWELPPEVDMAITSIYYFLIKNNDIDCFHNDERGESPFMLAMQNRAEFSFMKDLLSRPIPLQYNKFGENCFHYLARSYASETKFALIKAELVKNHIPYDPNHLRPPHVVPGSGAG